MMDGTDDSLEAAIRKNLRPRSITTIAPTPPRAARENPEYCIEQAITMVKKIIDDLQRDNPSAKVILTGRSYGGFIALLVACRMDFENILKVITIESPLSPDATVGPPLLIPPLALCGPHYENRPTLAREAVTFLKRRGPLPLVMIQGSDEDNVVPLEAQFLMEGTRVPLPADLGSDSSGLKRALPASYRNHLFWSEAKMRCVMEIIKDAARPTR